MRRSGFLYRFHDVLIACAAAEVTLESIANLSGGWIGIFGNQIDGAHHHTAGTKAALKRVTLLKSGLHGVHGSVGRR